MFDSVIVEPKRNARSAVIWLHGLGASGHDFKSIVPLIDPDISSIRFIFPNATRIPITVNGGMVMPAWYDIKYIDIDRTIDVPGISASANRIDAIIQDQINSGIMPERILLVGFSQGGAVALYTGVRSSEPLGGILALSAYWVGSQDPQLKLGRSPGQLFIEIHHGTADPVVPYELGERAAKSLSSLGYPVTFKAFSMQHSVIPEQLEVIGDWILSRICGKE